MIFHENPLLADDSHIYSYLNLSKIGKDVAKFVVCCSRDWHFKPRGGTLIFSHIRRLGLFFGVQNSEFQYFLGFSKKMNIFGGYEEFVDIFWGSLQNWASLRVISMQFRVFF